MAAIDRDQLILDEYLWLPTNNVLTETQMRAINEFVIANELPADDDQYYAQALCLGLRAIATANLGKATGTISTGLKKEKVGDTEVEYFGAGQIGNGWQDFINSLQEICPIFGYYGLASNIGIKITPGCPPIVNPCCDTTDDLEF